MKAFKITLEGKTCVMDDPFQLVDELFNMFVTGEQTEPVTIQVVEMTEEEYEKLEEFDGY